ncbi:hypothetical protein PM8797T_23379 [Gimesia maris DSM 8797]|nr:hypothetical protein PM8797T_23379 [Gimesia maris DSM 8797]
MHNSIGQSLATRTLISGIRKKPEWKNISVTFLEKNVFCERKYAYQKISMTLQIWKEVERE